MKDITILISAAGSPTMPGQISCYRNNGERKIKIVGIDMTDDPTIMQMVDVFYQVPAATDKSYVDIVLDICRKENVDVYFPNITAEVTAVSKRLDEFDAIATKVSSEDIEIVEILNNKLQVYKYLEDNGIPVPKYYPVYSVQDFIEGCAALGYPEKAVCLKLTENSGSRGVRIIDSTKNRYQIFAHEKPNSFFTSYEDMLSILKSVDKIDEMMLVEYMPGNEYTVDLLADKGETLYIAGKENEVSLMSIAQKSVVTKIESAYDICMNITKLFNYTGCIGFDFMKNSDGIPMLMDINPRLTATVSVLAAAGVNLPYLRIKQLLRESLPACTIKYGTTLVRRYGEYITDGK